MYVICKYVKSYFHTFLNFNTSHLKWDCTFFEYLLCLVIPNNYKRNPSCPVLFPLSSYNNLSIKEKNLLMKQIQKKKKRFYCLILKLKL